MSSFYTVLYNRKNVDFSNSLDATGQASIHADDLHPVAMVWAAGTYDAYLTMTRKDEDGLTTWHKNPSVLVLQTDVRPLSVGDVIVGSLGASVVLPKGRGFAPLENFLVVLRRLEDLEEELAEYILEPIRVVIEYIGEGRYGDYDEFDAEAQDDYPHARFSVLRRATEEEKAQFGDEWVAVDDASYCTTVDARSRLDLLENFARQLAEEFHDPIVSGHSVKKLGEQLSWWGLEE